jgi:hypothetical protein
MNKNNALECKHLGLSISSRKPVALGALALALTGFWFPNERALAADPVTYDIFGTLTVSSSVYSIEAELTLQNAGAPSGSNFVGFSLVFPQVGNITYSVDPAQLVLLSGDLTSSLNSSSLLLEAKNNQLVSFSINGDSIDATFTPFICHSSEHVKCLKSGGFKPVIVEGDGHELIKSITPTSVPEPGTLTLLFCGLVGILCPRRIRRRTTGSHSEL